MRVCVKIDTKTKTISEIIKKKHKRNKKKNITFLNSFYKVTRNKHVQKFKN